MASGRKNLRRAAASADTSSLAALALQPGESVMRVVSLRGSNLVEVMDPQGVQSLAFFPAKFHKSFWIKRGSYLVVDASGRDQALQSGSKVACVVSQVLFRDQVRALEKSPHWPAVFKNSSMENNPSTKPSSAFNTSSNSQQTHSEELEKEPGSDEDDGLPPLEANTNRNRPFELHSNSSSDSESE